MPRKGALQPRRVGSRRLGPHARISEPEHRGEDQVRAVADLEEAVLGDVQLLFAKPRALGTLSSALEIDAAAVA